MEPAVTVGVRDGQVAGCPGRGKIEPSCSRLEQPARRGPGEALLGGLATHSDGGTDDRPGDPGLAGAAHRFVKVRLGRGGGPCCGDDSVHQFLTRFAQHTLRSHHSVNHIMT